MLVSPGNDLLSSLISQLHVSGKLEIIGPPCMDGRAIWGPDQRVTSNTVSRFRTLKINSLH